MDQSLTVKNLVILVDGQNFISQIRKLFIHEFAPEDYLPRQAKWSWLFQSIARNLGAETVNTYWYTIKELDYYPQVDWDKEDLNEFSNEQYAIWKRHLIRKRIHEIWEDGGRVSPAEKAYKQSDSRKARRNTINQFRQICYENEREMRNRLSEWHQLQDNIVAQFPSTRIRRIGWQLCNTVDKYLQREKGVDIGLATDLVLLEPYYDTALLFSGDGDFVPAIKVMQRRGKTIGNVEYGLRNGKILPGTAEDYRKSPILRWKYHSAICRSSWACPLDRRTEARDRRLDRR